MSTTAGTTASDRIREQRDRFLAFAFAGSDVLVEAGSNDTVGFCAGASDKLFGLPNDKVVGRSLADMVIETDRPTLAEALRRLRRTGRLEHIRLRFENGSVSPQAAMVSGINLPNTGDTLHLSISRMRSGGGTARANERPLGEKLSTKDFASLVEQRLKESQQSGDPCTLTLLDLSDVDLRGASPEEFLNSVEATLRAWSVGGDSVGQLGNGKVGVIHDRSVQPQTLTERVESVIREVAPDADLNLRSTAMEMEPTALSAEDVTKALVYTINRFVAQGGEDFSIKSLTDGYKAAMSDTLARVNQFRATINSDRFIFVFQPIVCLNTWEVHHYEALARITQGERAVLPSQFISFAEDVGVVSELDMVVCKKAMAILSENRLIDRKSHIAINLSGRSLANPTFVHQLIVLLEGHRHLLPRLLFEVTESSEIKDLTEANNIVQRLRKFGCKTCLDDFGAGSAAFTYLRSLEVDYVKIDGSYILDAFDSRHGKPFLKAMANLCLDMGMRTIGEMVEDERAVKLLRDLKVDYGQGYYFAKPQPDVSNLVLPPKPQAPHSRGR